MLGLGFKAYKMRLIIVGILPLKRGLCNRNTATKPKTLRQVCMSHVLLRRPHKTYQTCDLQTVFPIDLMESDMESIIWGLCSSKIKIVFGTLTSNRAPTRGRLISMLPVALHGSSMLIDWVLPPLTSSWIISTMGSYIALNRTPNIDCYWEGAVPN